MREVWNYGGVMIETTKNFWILNRKRVFGYLSMSNHRNNELYIDFDGEISLDGITAKR
jgi:hypothetical protein